MRKIIAALLCFALLIGCVPAFAVSAADSYKVGDVFTVTGNNVRLRTQPSTETGKIIRELSYGSTVTLCGDFGEWANVKAGNDTGWVYAQYLKKGAPVASGELLDHGSILARLDQLRVKFPDGKYWNHYGSDKAMPDSYTDTPCHTGSGRHPNTKWCNGQCDGWARKIGQDLFGTTPPWNGNSTKWERKYTLNGLCIGDLIRFGGWHTIVVTGFTEDPDYIIISDCNWDMKCGIDWDRGFDLGRYESKYANNFYVEHYKGNTLNREAYFNPITTTTTTTTATEGTSAITTVTTATTTATTTTTTTTATTTTTTTTTAPASGSNNGKTDKVRLGGEDRFQTAALISAKGWSSADTVIIAGSHGFADALAGVPLAYALDAPILLVNGVELSKYTVSEIERLGAENAIILGGTASVSAEAQSALSTMGLTVRRISGENRFETAEKIARAMEEAGAVRSKTVFFASAYNYPDALAVSSIAAMNGSPILYAPTDGQITKGAADIVEELGFTQAVVLGGEAAISAKVQKSIADCGLAASRCGGANRYETAVKISEKFSSLFSGKTVCFATGRNFPDALAGGVLAAKLKSPVVLVDNSADIGAARKFVGGINPKTAYVFGGTAVLGSEVVDECLKG